MEFGLDTTSSVSDEQVMKHTEQRDMSELSDHDMSLLMSVHGSVFVHLVSSSWFCGDKMLLPKINVVQPYLLAYRCAAVLIRHCAHVLGMLLYKRIHCVLIG